MSVFAASAARNEFGRLLDTARREPVEIQKQGRTVAMLLSIEDYISLEEAQDALLEIKAQQAEAAGMLSVEESNQLLSDIDV